MTTPHIHTRIDILPRLKTALAEAEREANEHPDYGRRMFCDGQAHGIRFAVQALEESTVPDHTIPQFGELDHTPPMVPMVIEGRRPTTEEIEAATVDGRSRWILATDDGRIESYDARAATLDRGFGYLHNCDGGPCIGTWRAVDATGAPIMWRGKP